MKTIFDYDTTIGDLVGKTPIGARRAPTYVTFAFEGYIKYTQYYRKDCCETVEVKITQGKINDLVGSKITEAYTIDLLDNEVDLNHNITHEASDCVIRAENGNSVEMKWFVTSNGCPCSNGALAMKKSQPYCIFMEV